MKDQVPLWATFVIAGIALVGSVGGAWLNGFFTVRRDDKRWQRERERANLDYWRDKRVEVYADVIDQARESCRRLRELAELVQLDGLATAHGSLRRLRELNDSGYKRQSEVIVVGSTEVVVAAGRLNRSLTDATNILADYARQVTDHGLESDDVARVASAIDAAERTSAEFSIEARRSLDVHDPEDDDLSTLRED
ncbi:hypothetical protein FB384_003377 [Prauserella sediminis]|uniref:Uncharacterized protein n=1 Tax=Prauserella sediminis TaxID=577680 RepID=A0A839XVA4_9PSEU|nr:hypothetical protein [Prauserella sediminis]MBB3664473.1 hypothetical protein [Prauserella sediminis]